MSELYRQMLEDSTSATIGLALYGDSPLQRELALQWALGRRLILWSLGLRG